MDIGAIGNIHRQIIEERDQGKAILFASVAKPLVLLVGIIAGALVGDLIMWLLCCCWYSFQNTTGRQELWERYTIKESVKKGKYNEYSFL